MDAEKIEAVLDVVAGADDETLERVADRLEALMDQAGLSAPPRPGRPPVPSQPDGRASGPELGAA